MEYNINPFMVAGPLLLIAAIFFFSGALFPKIGNKIYGKNNQDWKESYKNKFLATVKWIVFSLFFLLLGIALSFLGFANSVSSYMPFSKIRWVTSLLFLIAFFCWTIFMITSFILHRERNRNNL